MSLRYFYKEGAIKDITKGPFDLATQTVAVNTDDAEALLFHGNEYTISFFVKIDAYDKSSAEPVSIIEHVNSWALEYIPSTNPAYQFRIATVDEAGKHQIERMALPLLPQQKWVYVSILREGRRIDVLYNDKIVGSTYLQNFPLVQRQPIRIGNPALRGVLALINGAPKRYAPADIGSERASRSNTRGEPYLNKEFVLPTLGCPGGLFCGPSIPPVSSSRKFWSSPYA